MTKSTIDEKAINKKIGQRIKTARVAAGLTQAMLAERVGVTYQQFHKYEVGVNRIAVGRLCSIAQVLERDLGWFFETIKDDIPMIDGRLGRGDIDTMLALQRLDPTVKSAIAHLARAITGTAEPASDAA